DQFVMFRTPLAVVHAVENAADGAGAVAQYAVQPEAEFRGLDLLAVLAADGGDVVGKDQGALQEIHFAPEFHLVDGQQVPGQHQQGQRIRRKDSLVAQVVDGKNRKGVTEDRVGGVTGAQQHGNKRRLPVVTVEDVRHAGNLGRLHYRSRIQREALGIVRVIAGGGAVQGLAVEELGAIDKIKLHAGVAAAIDHGAKAVLIVKGNGDAPQHDLAAGQPGLFIFRQVDGNGVAQCGERLGQSAHDIGKSASFGEGHALRRGK